MELMYYRIFKRCFGDLDDVSRMGQKETSVCSDRCEEYMGYRCE
jgi:hypothetical protein